MELYYIGGIVFVQCTLENIFLITIIYQYQCNDNKNRNNKYYYCHYVVL